MCRVGINPGTIVHQLAKTKAGLGELYIGRVRAECDGFPLGRSYTDKRTVGQIRFIGLC